MSSWSQAWALATPMSALRSPRTPAITAPAVTAKYALITTFTTAGGDRSMVSRSRDFSASGALVYRGLNPPTERAKSPPPPHWISRPRSPDTLMPAIFESREGGDEQQPVLGDLAVDLAAEVGERRDLAGSTHPHRIRAG